MSEEGIGQEGAREVKTSFEIGGKEFQVRAPKGKNGRRSSARVMDIFSKIRQDGDGSGLSEAAVMTLITDPDFEAHHLANYIGVDQKFLDEEGTIMEILDAVMATTDFLFKGLEEPDVDNAVKN